MTARAQRGLGPYGAKLNERCSDGVEHQAAEEAFLCSQEGIVMFVVEAVSHRSSLSFQRVEKGSPTENFCGFDGMNRSGRWARTPSTSSRTARTSTFSPRPTACTRCKCCRWWQSTTTTPCWAVRTTLSASCKAPRCTTKPPWRGPCDRCTTGGRGRCSAPSLERRSCTPRRRVGWGRCVPRFLPLMPRRSYRCTRRRSILQAGSCSHCL
jgi:hypothetical protein